MTNKKQSTRKTGNSANIRMGILVLALATAAAGAYILYSIYNFIYYTF